MGGVALHSLCSMSKRRSRLVELCPPSPSTPRSAAAAACRGCRLNELSAPGHTGCRVKFSGRRGRAEGGKATGKHLGLAHSCFFLTRLRTDAGGQDGAVPSRDVKRKGIKAARPPSRTFVLCNHSLTIVAS